MADRIKINPISSDQISTLLMGEAGKEKIIGAKDKGYTDFRGTVPISDAEARIDRIRKNAGEAKDAILGGFWEAVKGGAETVHDIYKYGPRGVPQHIKEQRAAEAKAMLDKVKKDEQLQIDYQKALANRRDIRTVRAELAQVIAAAQKREDNNPGSVNQDELEARLLAYTRANGYTANEIQGGDDVDVDLMPDPYGLTTDSPNPFPEAENIMKFGGGVSGNILGYRMSRNWAIAQPSWGNMGKAATAFGRGVKAGWNPLKFGPYWGRIAGALAGGLVGVLTADYGYETALDISNASGVFGKQGINRPGVAPRVRSLLNTAEMEVKLTMATGYLAPAVNGLRNVSRLALGVRQPQMLVSEKGMRLSEKFMPEGQYGGKRGWIKETGEPESIVGITDISAFRAVQGIPNVMGKFPLIGGGIQKNLADRAAKLNVILDNMTNRIAPAVGYNRLSEAVVASSKLTVNKLTKELDVLRKEWFSHAIARGANVRLAGKIGDGSPHAIITDFKAHMAQTAGKGIDGTPLPVVVKNRLNTFFDNILAEPGSVTLARADTMLEELGHIMKMGGMKTNPTAISFAENFALSIQNAMRQVNLGEAGTAALRRYDKLWQQGQMLMKSDTAKKLGFKPDMLYGYQSQLMNQGIKYADDLLHTAKLMESPEALRNLHTFVGPDIFRGMMRRHIVDAYDSALKTWPGKSFLADTAGALTQTPQIKTLAAGQTQFGLSAAEKAAGATTRSIEAGQATAKAIDPQKFITNLGLDNQGGRLYAQIDEGLKLAAKGEPGKGIQNWMKHMPEELIDAGADAKTIQILGGKAKQVTPGFVTAKDLTDFAQILESSFRDGIPDISTFIARRAQISGVQGALRAFLPGKTIAGGATVGGALPAVSMVHAVMFSLLARQGGKILTNPINLKAANQILKATDEDIARIWNPFTYHKFGSAPKALAVKNALQTIGANFNGELEELDMTLNDVMNQQGRRDQIEKVTQPTGEENLREKINIFEKMKQAAQAKQGIREESLAPAVTGAATAAPISPTSVDTTAGNTFGGGATGSSIAQNQVMNPNAAASLYAGNTDAALANQFGVPNAPTQQMPRMAAKGGIISLVS